MKSRRDRPPESEESQDSGDENVAALCLVRSEGIGPATFHHLITRYGSAIAALAALPELERRNGRSSRRVYSETRAREEIDALDALGARLLAHGDCAYPQSLATLPDAPPMVSVMGRGDLLRRPAIAIVGARNASSAGIRFPRTLAGELGEAGFAVVSGLARGIDSAAHLGSLATGSIAVLAGGIDQVYPPENDSLQQSLADRGLLLAEQRVGTQPRARHFPTRNRLISGLSLGVVVVETACRSGSLITARCALDQGREVFAVPGSPLDPRCRGRNEFIRDGAVLVQTIDDIISIFAPPRQAARGSSAFPQGNEISPNRSADEYDRMQHRVASALGPTPVTVDELMRQCQLTPPELLTILHEFETAGRLQRHPGNRVSYL